MNCHSGDPEMFNVLNVGRTCGALKLPTFWSSQPEVWFAQAEAQLSLRKITADDTKYYFILAALNQRTATRLLDLISHPPADDKYKALKTRLIDMFGLSERDRASRFLHFRELGDTKPSVLMGRDGGPPRKPFSLFPISTTFPRTPP